MSTRSALCCLTALYITSLANADEDEGLFLRVQDATGLAGHQAAISVRTYASRPISQGQLCLRLSDSGDKEFPLKSLKGLSVYGSNDDVSQQVIVTGGNRGGNRGGNQDIEVLVQFLSPSSSINDIDGPLVAMFFEIDDSATPGEEWRIALDLPNTFLFDEIGAPIPVEVRAGSLEIRDPAAPIEVEVEGEQELPGDPVRIVFETEEPFTIGSGQIGIRYSSRVLPGAGTLRLDPRFGTAQVKLDGYPGLVVLRVLSTSADFNNLPGHILAVEFAPNPAAGANINAGIVFDPALTFLRDADGNLISLELENGDSDFQRSLTPRVRDPEGKDAKR